MTPETVGGVHSSTVAAVAALARLTARWAAGVRTAQSCRHVPISLLFAGLAEGGPRLGAPYSLGSLVAAVLPVGYCTISLPSGCCSQGRVSVPTIPGAELS